jgi:outer membrane protein OmpA-like peptidoglycan-associated protein
MKKSHLFSLSLAAALAIPAVAQQNQSSTPSDQPQSQSSTPSDQPQSQPTQAQPSGAEQQPAATGKEPLKYERHEGFWGHMNPFARKKYVSRQLDPVRGRVNELDELTAKNSKMIADVDSRATEGIRNAMGKANEADSHALDAGNRANQAQQTADSATTRIAGVEQTVNKLDQYEAVTQTEIRFRPGQTVLSQNAKDALDQIATTLKNQKGYILEVQGFSPGAGGAAIENSRQMAQMVVRYLVLNHDVPVYRIYTVGMGNAPLPSSEDGKLHRARGGRVEINLMKNSLGTVASNTADATPPVPASGGVSGAATPAPASKPIALPVTPAANAGAAQSTNPK